MAMVVEAQKLSKDQLTIPEKEPTSMVLQPDPRVKKICLGLEYLTKMALIGADLSEK